MCVSEKEPIFMSTILMLWHDPNEGELTEEDLDAVSGGGDPPPGKDTPRTL
jgi:hypothetical protein